MVEIHMNTLDNFTCCLFATNHFIKKVVSLLNLFRKHKQDSNLLIIITYIISVSRS